MQAFKCERLQNGFIRCDHRGSGLVSLWEADGRHRSGSASLGAALAVQAFIAAPTAAEANERVAASAMRKRNYS